MPKVFSKFDTNVFEMKGKSYQIKYMLCNICNTKAMAVHRSYRYINTKYAMSKFAVLENKNAFLFELYTC